MIQNNSHKENIKRLKNDPVKFVEDLFLDMFGQPIEMKHYQKQIIKKLGRNTAEKLGGKYADARES